MVRTLPASKPGQLHPPRQHARRSRLVTVDGSPRGLVMFAMAAGASAIGLLALGVVGGEAVGSGPDPFVRALLSASFLFSLIVIVVTSSARDMQISLQTMMLYFAIFLILPGYAHVSNNEFPFPGLRYADSVQRDASLMVTMFLPATVIGYWLARRVIPRRISKPTVGPLRFRGSVFVASLLLSAAFLGALLYISTVGIGNVFQFRSDQRMSGVDVTGFGLMIVLPRVFCTMSLVYGLALWRFTGHKQLGKLFTALSILPALVTLWPPILPRSISFGTLLLISMLYVQYSLPGRRLALSGLYLFGALVAMPVVDAITRYGASVFDLSAANVFGRYVNSGDFDGLQSLNNAALLVDAEGFSYGHQLISALLFFVPRAIWPDKAEPTGSIAADIAGYDFVNVSMPLPGELFVDFGWAGVIVGALIVGWVLCWVDRYIDSHWIGDAKGRLIAGAMVGYAIAIYRGTLIGVVAPVAALVVMILIVNKWGLRPIRTSRAPIRRGIAPIPRD